MYIIIICIYIFKNELVIIFVVEFAKNNLLQGAEKISMSLKIVCSDIINR